VLPAAGTVNFSVVGFTTVTVARTPLIFAVTGAMKLFPVTVITAPAAPESDDNDVICGTSSRFDALVAVPFGVTTETFAVGVFAGSAGTSISSSPTTVNPTPGAPIDTAPTRTVVAPVNVFPWIASASPPDSDGGSRLVIRGVTPNTPTLSADAPPPTSTSIFPFDAPAGTVPFTCVGETTLNDDALTPLNFTSAVPEKPVPLIVTCVPTGPDSGANVDNVGSTVKSSALSPVPAGPVTEIGPNDAAAGTVALTWFADTTVYVAGTPLNSTAVEPVKLLPLIVICAPVFALIGTKLLIVGVFETAGSGAV
jgi:hypothetical protein